MARISRNAGQPLANRICTKRAQVSSFDVKTKLESKQSIRELVDDVQGGVSVVSLSIPPEGHTFVVVVVPTILAPMDSGLDSDPVKSEENNGSSSKNSNNSINSRIDNENDTNIMNARNEIRDNLTALSINIHDHRKTYAYDLKPTADGFDRSQRYREFLHLLEVKFGAKCQFIEPDAEIKSRDEYQRRLVEGGACMYYSDELVKLFGMQ